MVKVLIVFLVLAAVCFSFSEKVGVLEFDYGSSEEQYEFIWSQDGDSYLEQLLAEFNLPELVADCESELEKVLKVTNWVSNLWEHSGINEPEKSDPISILREVQQGERFRCVEYSIVIDGCLNALGIPSRRIGLKMKNVETKPYGAGHVAVEAYLDDFKKWVYVDGQWNLVPSLEGIPLNSIELQQAIVENKTEIQLLTAGAIKGNNFLDWIIDYLYYFDVALDNRVVNREPNFSLMLVPQGATEPQVFQIQWPIENMIYTNSVNAFYPQL